MPGKATIPPIEVTIRMFPRRRSRIPGSTALIVATAPNTFTSNWRRRSCIEDSSRVPSWPYPALTTSTSTGPIFSTVGCTAASSVTSSR